jgi:hypothetical protein
LKINGILFGYLRNYSYVSTVIEREMNKALRFFKCELTQMEWAIVLVGGDEIRVPAEMVPYYLTQK